VRRLFSSLYGEERVLLLFLGLLTRVREAVEEIWGEREILE
jgi:hypothetical protein